MSLTLYIYQSYVIFYVIYHATQVQHSTPPSFTLSQRVDGEGKFTAFYSASRTMSSFYHANFVDNDGTTFHCSEQKYQYDKAVEFNDNVSAHRILSASTALECFKIGQSIVGFKDEQ